MRTNLTTALLSAILICPHLATRGHCTMQSAPAGATRGVHLSLQRSRTLHNVDRSDARSVAQSVLEAYRAGAPAALARLASESNQALLEEMGGRGDPLFDAMFADWRREALQDWDGGVGQVRYWERVEDDKKTIEAQVECFDLTEGELFVATLIWEDGGWSFQALGSRDRIDFAQGSLAFSKP